MPEFARILEEEIENCVVGDPARYLGPKVALVARQPVIDDHRPDLLGIDAKGKLVIFELKATPAKAGAVSQGDRYRKALEQKSTPEIVRLIERYSGRHGVEQVTDFTAWYKARFPRKQLDSLRPFRVAIVSLGADSSARRRLERLTAEGVDITHIDLGGMELVSPAQNKLLRKPQLKTSGSWAQQLRQNCEYHECEALFDRVHSDISRHITRISATTYQIGIWWNRPAPPQIGLDVFREGIGAVGVLIFNRSVSPEIRDAVDHLRQHLVWVGDSYTTDKAVHTVLVIHSLAEWRAHRGQILDIADKINTAP